MISSLVVGANDDFAKELADIKEANIEQILEGKYIVIIQSKDFDDNLRVFNKIKALNSVYEANLCFCEAEDESLQINAQKIADKINNTDINDIKYYGNIYKKY